MGESGSNGGATIDVLRAWLIDWLACDLGVDPRGVDPGQAFLSYGMNSVQAMTMVGDLESHLGLRLPPTLAWDYPDIDRLAMHLADRLAAEPGAAAPAPKAPRTEPPGERAEVESLLAGLDALSDHEVDRLLEQFLGEGQ
jgi:acyl carrier protein